MSTFTCMHTSVFSSNFSFEEAKVLQLTVGLATTLVARAKLT